VIDLEGNTVIDYMKETKRIAPSEGIGMMNNQVSVRYENALRDQVVQAGLS